MHVITRRAVFALLAILCLVSAPQARAELVATKDGTKFVTLTPLRNGLSAITLVWPMDRLTQDRVNALRAGLSSVLTGGTPSRSAYEIDAFLRLKGIEQNVKAYGRDLMLTVSAPNDVFPEALSHLGAVLLEADYSRRWFERELQQLELTISSNTGTPADVLNEVAHFLYFDPDDHLPAGDDAVFRFGRPSQAILRSEDPAAEDHVRRLLHSLPGAKWKLKLPLAKWAAALIDKEEPAFALPTGVIHYADPASTEMLILFVKAAEFKDEADQIGTNLLVDYIGDNTGSELFRIIRQEMRAAYDPRSDFVIINKNRSVLSFSATVEADQWPDIHATMTEIYEKTRAGDIDLSGLKIQRDLLMRNYYGHFFNTPLWGAQQYLSEYPNGAKGSIMLPLFAALEDAPLEKIVADSAAHLPPLDDYLMILIGGGTVPADTLTSNDYCALPKNTPLAYCLEALSNKLN